MRIAVTGATGTVGAAFAERALAAGHDLVLLARNIPAQRPDWGEWQEFDLLSETAGDKLVEALRGVGVAVHLAAKIDINPADDVAARAMFEANVLGTGRLIGALAEADVPRLVMASSANIYDPAVPVADEDTAIRPTSRALYLSSKIAQESYARALCDNADISCAIMRISSVVATGSDILSCFIAKAIEGQSITLDNPGFGSDLIALEDVASGLLMAAEADFSGNFNLSSGVRRTLEDIVAMVAERTGLKPNINRAAAGAGADNGFPAIDCSRLRALGYAPQPLESVIDQLIAGHRGAAAGSNSRGAP